MTENQAASVAVVGLGYVGLPTAVLLARSGAGVVGVDIDPEWVKRLGSLDVHIEEPGLRAELERAVRQNRLRMATEVPRVGTYVIAVPTPVIKAKQPDLSMLELALAAVGKVLEPGALVVIESTSPPRMTTDFAAPRLLKASGLSDQSDYDLAYCPERVLPGNAMYELVHNDRVLGGTTSRASSRAAELYRRFVRGELHETTSLVAEMVKLVENSSRDVNIALANEYARIAEKVGVDVWEVIGLANRHPRVHILKPGPGVGGHCIAVDPWFLIASAPEEARMLQLARAVNDRAPALVVQRADTILSGANGKTVLCLGLAYKADSGDLRESPGVVVAQELARRGARVLAHEPNLSGSAPEGLTMIRDVRLAARSADLVLVLTDHVEYRSLSHHDLGLDRGVPLLDTRRLPQSPAWKRNGLPVEWVGDGTVRQPIRTG